MAHVGQELRLQPRGLDRRLLGHLEGVEGLLQLGGALVDQVEGVGPTAGHGLHDPEDGHRHDQPDHEHHLGEALDQRPDEGLLGRHDQQPLAVPGGEGAGVGASGRRELTGLGAGEDQLRGVGLR